MNLGKGGNKHQSITGTEAKITWSIEGLRRDPQNSTAGYKNGALKTMEMSPY